MNPRSLANLKPPNQKGQVLNPSGKNGRTRAEILGSVMEEPSETDPERSKIEMVIRAQYRRALKGSDIAAKTLIEQYSGRARQQRPGTLTKTLRERWLELVQAPPTEEEITQESASQEQATEGQAPKGEGDDGVGT